MRKWMFLLVAAGLLVAIVMVWRNQSPNTNTATPAPAQPTTATQAPPQSMPPMTGNRPPNMPDAEGPYDDNAVALKLSGLNSAEEMNKELQKLGNADLRGDFERAYRMTFSARQAQRNYPEAMQIAQHLLEHEPGFAPAHRLLGYARFNTGDQMGAVESYKKAVEIDSNYGEGQYALAFMLAMMDPTTGAEHFKKAMALGVKDERGIGPRYFGINP